MTRFFSFLILPLLLSSSVWAMKVEDPDNQASHLQMMFPSSGGDFFTCGEPVAFMQSTSHCDFLCVDEHQCRTTCADMPVQKFVMAAENCNPETVDIVDTIGWEFKAQAHPSERFGQTWIEDFLTATDFFIAPSGTYHLDFVMPPQTRVVVDENGEEVPVEAVTIFLSFRQSPELSPVNLELVLDLNKRGLEQILYFGFQEHNEYFLKKWGLL